MAVTHPQALDRRWDKTIAGWAIRTGMLALAERAEAVRLNVLRILAYHRIGHLEECIGKHDPGLISASPEDFDRQMSYLAENYRVISLEELLAADPSMRPLSPRSVLITFDDGYRDFLHYACPILRRYHLPSVLFVATGFLSNGDLYWWDTLYRAFFHTERQTLSLPSYGEWQLRTRQQRDQALRQVKRIVQRTDHSQAMKLVQEIRDQLGSGVAADNGLLSWEEIGCLCRDGVYIGAHTRSHPILSRLPSEEARQEILGSQMDLWNALGQTWPVFAFPVGHASHLRQDLLPSLEKAGFRAAVTMIEGHNTLGKSHPMLLKRLGVAPHLTLAEFRMALTGIYDIYGTLRTLSQSLQERQAPSLQTQYAPESESIRPVGGNPDDPAHLHTVFAGEVKKREKF